MTLQPHTIRVLIGNDRSTVRRGIKALLAQTEDVRSQWAGRAIGGGLLTRKSSRSGQ